MEYLEAKEWKGKYGARFGRDPSFTTRYTAAGVVELDNKYVKSPHRLYFGT